MVEIIHFRGQYFFVEPWPHLDENSNMGHGESDCDAMSDAKLT